MKCDQCSHAAVCNIFEPEANCPHFEESRKTGKWIPADDAIIAGHCSACGWAAIYDETDIFGMPYCPNCGSKLET